MRGLGALCTGLSDIGVRHVFGLPGTRNAELFNALPEHGIRPVLATHETSASFMANGYARASGRVGVLATIPGPGFTFAIPGLAEARLDSVPLLHLVGTPARGEMPFQHQAIDQASIAGPLVKGVVEIRAADEVGRRIREAHTLALEGEPGPVLVHLDHDVLSARTYADTVGAREASGHAGVVEPAWAGDLRRLVAASDHPVLFVGAGALSCAESVARLADRLAAPIFTTLTARGVLAEDHPCSMAFDADRGGVEELNALLDHSDLVLALGCKFTHNGTAGFRIRLPEDRLVHVNTDAASLGESYAARLEIQAKVEDVLSVLMDHVDQGWRSLWTPAEIADARARIGRPHPPRWPEPRFADVPGATAEAFFALVRQVLPRDGIVVTDSGLHQVMTRRYYQVLEPRGLITPADFQSMGFGLPAAIGAALAAPSRPVVAMVGDGGFLMSAMELASAARERVPVVVVVFNDGFLNLIRMQQIREDGHSTAIRVPTPDLDGLAAALSVGYGRLGESTESVLREALEARVPALLEVRLGDSTGIRAMRGLAFTRRVARRTLGEALLDRLRDVRKAFRRR